MKNTKSLHTTKTSETSKSSSTLGKFIQGTFEVVDDILQRPHIQLLSMRYPKIGKRVFKFFYENYDDFSYQAFKSLIDASPYGNYSKIVYSKIETLEFLKEELGVNSFSTFSQIVLDFHLRYLLLTESEDFIRKTLEVCSINNIAEFKQLGIERINWHFSSYMRKGDTFNYICERFKITNKKEFDSFFQYDWVAGLFENRTKIEKLFEHIKVGSQNELFSLFDTGHVRQFFHDGDDESFGYLLEHFKINNQGDFKKIAYVEIFKLPLKIVEFFVEKFSISSIDEAHSLKRLRNENILNTLRRGNFDTIGTLVNQYNIDSLENLMSFFNDHAMSSFVRYCGINTVKIYIGKFPELTEKEFLEEIRKKYNENTDCFAHKDNPPFNIVSSRSLYYEQLHAAQLLHPEKTFEEIFTSSLEGVIERLLHNRDTFSEEVILKNGERINKHHRLSRTKRSIASEIDINPNRHKISLYVRYEQQVDFPEIAEAMIYFTQKYIAGKYSRYFSGIRIIPRDEHYEKPSDFLLGEENTNFYSVSGSYFPIALHTFSSAIFFSHSTLKSPHKTPSITSYGMEKQPRNISSNIELERESQGNKKFAESEEIEVILRKFLQNFEDLEEKLDEYS